MKTTAISAPVAAQANTSSMAMRTFRFIRSVALPIRRERPAHLEPRSRRERGLRSGRDDLDELLPPAGRPRRSPSRSVLGSEHNIGALAARPRGGGARVPGARYSARGSPARTAGLERVAD